MPCPSDAEWVWPPPPREADGTPIGETIEEFEQRTRPPAREAAVGKATGTARGVKIAQSDISVRRALTLTIKREEALRAMAADYGEVAGRYDGGLGCVRARRRRLDREARSARAASGTVSNGRFPRLMTGAMTLTRRRLHSKLLYYRSSTTMVRRG